MTYSVQNDNLLLDYIVLIGLFIVGYPSLNKFSSHHNFVCYSYKRILLDSL